MAGRPKRRVGIVIDMTPMVDIAFLLLIFYMATTQFKPPEKESVALPRSTSEIKVPDKGIINITVNKYDALFVEYITKNRDTGEIVRESPEVTLRTLNYELTQARLKLGNPEIIVKADRESSFGTMRELMSTLQDVKIDHFSLMTDMKLSAPVPDVEPSS
ncbi:MAG: biopolymer transporter ExbD [candidate division Zixibacteria bacterium]|nr:biopolymer transporter ExbD [candidate division Zixibacteria bacterium]